MDDLTPTGLEDLLSRRERQQWTIDARPPFLARLDRQQRTIEALIARVAYLEEMVLTMATLVSTHEHPRR